MEQKNFMLKLGGYINILIAVAHIVGLFWADKMFEVTGIANEMTELAQTHSSLPYLLTIFIAVVFFIFGLSNANHVWRRCQTSINCVKSVKILTSIFLQLV